MSSRVDYDLFLNRFAVKCGLDTLTPDEEGLVRLLIGQKQTLNIAYQEATAQILVFLDVTKLPETVSSDVYRALLSAGLFGQEACGGWFALEPAENVIIYQRLFNFDPDVLSADVFLDAVEKILSLVEVWSGRLAGLLATENEPSTTADLDFSSSTNTILRV